MTTEVVNGSIDGLNTKNIKTFVDVRGFFREAARADDIFFAEGFKNLNHFELAAGQTQSWQVYPENFSWWYVPIGLLQIALYDTRQISSSYGLFNRLTIGESRTEPNATTMLKIPAGVAFGYRATTTCQIIRVTSDNLPQAFDGININYDWTIGNE